MDLNSFSISVSPLTTNGPRPLSPLPRNNKLPVSQNQNVLPLNTLPTTTIDMLWYLHKLRRLNTLKFDLFYHLKKNGVKK